MRDDRERLLDILESINRIEKYTSTDDASLERSELIQTWAMYYLQVIGEAVRRLSEGLRMDHPEVPWQEIIGMRNILVHHYFEIDVNIVKNAVTQDLPNLKSMIQNILQDLAP